MLAARETPDGMQFSKATGVIFIEERQGRGVIPYDPGRVLPLPVVQSSGTLATPARQQYVNNIALQKSLTGTPILVDFLLNPQEHPLVTGLEHVSESPLVFQVLLNRQIVLVHVGELILTLNLLIRNQVKVFRHPALKQRNFFPPKPAPT